MRTHLLLPLLVAALLAGCPDTNDDDDVATDDDDGAIEAQSCPNDASTPTAPPAGEWLDVPGWSTPGDGSADREVWLHSSGSAGSGAPLILFLTGRTAPTQAGIEQEVADLLALRDWADAGAWIAAVPLPGPAEMDNLGWYVGSPDDLDYFAAALDAVEDAYAVDRNRIHLVGWGEGGRIALYLAQAFSERIASVIDFAGPSPWAADPPALPWPRPVPAMFIHGPSDALVPLAAVEEAAAVFEAAGAPVHTWYDYPVGHEWDPSIGGELQLEIARFLGLYCLSPE